MRTEVVILITALPQVVSLRVWWHNSGLAPFNRTSLYYLSVRVWDRVNSWVRNNMDAYFFEEIGSDISRPFPLLLDSKSAIQVTEYPEHQSTMEHVRLAYHWICDHIEKQPICIARTWRHKYG